MKATAPTLPAALPGAWSRAADYLELTKPRVGVLVLFTVAAGAVLGARGLPEPGLLLNVLAGTALVVGGASALNQYLERHSDALMLRTENRPLPSGRLAAGEVLVFGLVLGVAGVVYLAAACPRPLASVVAATAFLSYVFVYTPLKRYTTLNTLVGAVPGALPPVIGWAAVRGSVGPEVTVIFLLVYLWQIPHFLAIAWMYRDEYGRAGLRMLPVVDRAGRMTARQMVSYCLALIPVSLTPALLGVAGPVYCVGVTTLGLAFLGSAIGFTRCLSAGAARRVLFVSLVYLPGVLFLLLADGRSLPWALAFWG